jgi:Tat protein secretion system quality control protein TatD with DNase activity
MAQLLVYAPVQTQSLLLPTGLAMRCAVMRGGEWSWGCTCRCPVALCLNKLSSPWNQRAGYANGNECGMQVSVHCVRAYGLLLDGLKSMPMEKWPPKVMLHSYGGSVELVPAFAALPGGQRAGTHAGGSHGCNDRRVFFSFSAAIAGGGSEKAMARMRAVPADRILVETDLTSVEPMNDALEEIVRIIAGARAWTVEHTIKQTWDNFCHFYQGYL